MKKLGVAKQDLAIMIILSSIFFLISVWNLGRTNVPSTTVGFHTSGGEGFCLDLGSVERAVSVNVLLKKTTDSINFAVYTSTDGVNFWKTTETSLNSYYCWRSIYINAETRYIKFILGLSSGEIAEIIVVGRENRIPISSVKGEGIDDEILSNLIDEQDKVEYPPTYMSETYFDEIYFVRTAEEYLKLEEPYESVHPPLGKLIIAVGIIIFGYNPFGWRIMGVIFATLMIPVMYLLGKRLFETRIAAFISAFLWVFEFMHFTMGRIGTVDTYVVFFSLISHLFFFIYLQGVLKNKADNRLLFLSVLFFALGFSTKWVVILGFIGDVFLLSAFRLRELLKTRVGWASRVYGLIQYPFSPLIRFLAVAVIIYLLTFIPYMMVGHTLIDVFSVQFGMFNYHATLKATHPFASPWWSWPIIQTPVWLYVSYLPNNIVSTITCMGNPAIWWFGVFCLMFVSEAVLKRSLTCLYIVTIFMFQWLLYAPISRCVFLYHFYSNVPFLVFAVTYLLNDLWGNKKTAYGKMVVLAYLIIVVAVFLLFYPVLSGQPCSSAWRESLRLLDSWIF